MTTFGSVGAKVVVGIADGIADGVSVVGVADGVSVVGVSEAVVGAAVVAMAGPVVGAVGDTVGLGTGTAETGTGDSDGETDGETDGPAGRSTNCCCAVSQTAWTWLSPGASCMVQHSELSTHTCTCTRGPSGGGSAAGLKCEWVVFLNGSRCEWAQVRLGLSGIGLRCEWA